MVLRQPVVVIITAGLLPKGPFWVVVINVLIAGPAYDLAVNVVLAFSTASYVLPAVECFSTTGDLFNMRRNKMSEEIRIFRRRF
jgi:hypothetical protein